MPDRKIEQPIIVDKHLGMFTSLPSHMIPDYYDANALNASFLSVGYFSSQLQYTRWLTSLVDGSFQPGSSTTFSRSNGLEIPMVVMNHTTKNSLYWINTFGTEPTLELLVDNLTANRRMAYSDQGYNTNSTDGIYFCDGVMDYSFWNGAIAQIASNTATVITLTAQGEYNTSAALGFAASGNVMVGGTVYAYTGISGLTLTGLTALPALTVGAAVYQGVTTYSGAPKFDIMAVNDGRVWGTNSDGVRVYGSEVGDGSNFTVPGTPVPSDPFFFDLIEGNGGMTGLQFFKGYMLLFKRNMVKYFSIDLITDTTRGFSTDILRSGDDLGAASPAGILTINNKCYYVSPKGGIRWVGESEAKDGFTFGDLTNPIRPTLKDGEFSTSNLLYHEKERILLATYQSDSTFSYNNKQIAIEFTEDDALVDVKPICIYDWPIATFFKLSENLYFGSSLEGKIFKAFDGYTKDGAPSLTVVTLKRYAFSNRFNRNRIKWIGVRGRMAPGQLIRFIVSYDRSSSLGTAQGFLSYDEGKYIFSQGTPPTIGSDPIGVSPIGGSLEAIEDLDPYLVFFTLPENQFPYDIELTVYNEGIDEEGNILGTRFTVEDVGFYASNEQLNTDNKRMKPLLDFNTNDV